MLRSIAHARRAPLSPGEPAAAGTAIGDYLAGSKPSAPAGSNPSTTGSTTPGATPGTRLPPQGAFPPGGPNVRRIARLTGKPAMAVNQLSGDPNTTFVILGAGFAPGTHVTIQLVGAGISPDHPPVDPRGGTFKYVIDQGHEFFPGPLPPGAYQVVVTAPGGVRRTATFTVTNGPPPPGPG